MPLSHKFWKGRGGRGGCTRRRLGVVEQRVEICDSRSGRGRGGRIPILYRYTDLLWIGVVGGVDIHGIAVILGLKTS